MKSKYLFKEQEKNLWKPPFPRKLLEILYGNIRKGEHVCILWYLLLAIKREEVGEAKKTTQRIIQGYGWAFSSLSRTKYE